MRIGNRIGDGYKRDGKGSGMYSDSLSSKWIDIKNARHTKCDGQFSLGVRYRDQPNIDDRMPAKKQPGTDNTCQQH